MCVCDKKHNCHASPKNGAEPALGLKSHLSNINRMQALAIPVLGNPVELGDVTNAIR